MSAVDCVVVAAGASSRMGDVDKLRAVVGGRPLLAWTLDAVVASPAVRHVVVVAAPDRVAELAGEPWLPPSVTAVVAGGPRRQDSVAAGVAALSPASPRRGARARRGAAARLARPPRACADAARRDGAAIPVVPVAETLKRVEGGRIAGTVDRATLAAAQTPQGVRRDVLTGLESRAARRSRDVDGRGRAPRGL